MATETYTHLQTVNVSADTSQVTISSIPSGYRDIAIEFYGIAGGSAALQPYIRFNSDSANNYGSIIMRDGASSGNQQTDRILIGLHNNPFDPNIGYWHLELFNYRQTGKYTTVINQSGSLDGIELTSHIWRSTSAVTQIDFFAGNTNAIGSGSYISLYGIVG